MLYSNAQDGFFEPMTEMTFVRLNVGSSAKSDRQVVQYRVQNHPDYAFLWQVIRGVGTITPEQMGSTNVPTNVAVPWLNSGYTLEEEVIHDNAMAFTVFLLRDLGTYFPNGVVTNRPAVIDINVAGAPGLQPPHSVLATNRLERLRQLDGQWLVRRVRPLMNIRTPSEKDPWPGN